MGMFDVKGCTDNIVEYLDKHDDGEKNALAKLVDPLKYKTKAQPGKKGLQAMFVEPRKKIGYFEHHGREVVQKGWLGCVGRSA